MVKNVESLNETDYANFQGKMDEVQRSELDEGGGNNQEQPEQEDKFLELPRQGRQKDGANTKQTTSWPKLQYLPRDNEKPAQ